MHSAGVVLQCYGAGNVPNNRTDVMEHLKEATDRGVLILSVTQCINGSVTFSCKLATLNKLNLLLFRSVSGLYATGKALLDIGIIPGKYFQCCRLTVTFVYKIVNYTGFDFQGMI